MAISSDSKKGSSPGEQQLFNNPLQQSPSSISKAAEATSSNNTAQNQNMATISDDDDRLLVRIGYTPVRIEISLRYIIQANC